MVEILGQAFIAIFVAMDALGVLPIYMSLTHGLVGSQKRVLIRQSLITALVVSLSFIGMGRVIFRFLGISISDFMVAGGLILLCLAMIDLLVPGKTRRLPAAEIGVVPLGTPLIVGPAVLTTSLMMLDQYGMVITCLSVVANIALTGFIFSRDAMLIKILGANGARVMSKIMAILLSAIAVMMVRKGIMIMVKG